MRAWSLEVARTKRTSTKSCFESADDMFSEKEKEDGDDETEGKLAMYLYYWLWIIYINVPTEHFQSQWFSVVIKLTIGYRGLDRQQ